MRFFKLRTLLLIAFVVAPLLAKPVTDDELNLDNDDGEVEIVRPYGFHPFVLGKSKNLVCPDSTGGESCPKHTFFYYYACCGKNNDDCCMQIQQWILFIFGLFVLAAIIFVIGRCIYHFCFKNRNVKK